MENEPNDIRKRLDDLDEDLKRLANDVKDLERTIDRNIKGLVVALIVAHTKDGSFDAIMENAASMLDSDVVETARRIIACGKQDGVSGDSTG